MAGLQEDLALEMADLGQFLLEAGNKRRVEGVWDCACLPADWAIACGHPDPMAKWRGAYWGESAALDLIDDAGGLVALFDEGLAGIGIKRRAGAAVQGDIGVIKIGEHEAGAVFAGKRWALVSERGMAFATMDDENIAAIWAVHCG